MQIHDRPLVSQESMASRLEANTARAQRRLDETFSKPTLGLGDWMEAYYAQDDLATAMQFRGQFQLMNHHMTKTLITST